MPDTQLVRITDDDLPSNLTADLDASRLAVNRPPEHVLEEAHAAAAALKRVIDGKAKPVMFNGDIYLGFEDWQTVGRFYGVTARVVSTEFTDFGGVQGFAARAEAVRADGQAISAAESMCLRDEGNWASKPLFQLRSMAQTRACAKALRNVLAWVVVLAGYQPTPAEEMDGVSRPPVRPIATPSAPNTGNPDRTLAPDAASWPNPGGSHDPGATLISESQAKRFWAISKQAGRSDDGIRAMLARRGLESTRDIPRSAYDALCKEAAAK